LDEEIPYGILRQGIDFSKREVTNKTQVTGSQHYWVSGKKEKGSESVCEKERTSRREQRPKVGGIGEEKACFGEGVSGYILGYFRTRKGLPERVCSDENEQSKEKNPEKDEENIKKKGGGGQSNTWGRAGSYLRDPEKPTMTRTCGIQEQIPC